MDIKAIIDIGSNSIRVVIYQVNVDLTFKIIDQEKSIVRLGSYLNKDNYINNEGVDITVRVLREFKDLCDIYGATEIDAVATEAIRKAKNGKDICNLIKSELGIDIRILSGKEEAFYGYYAVKNTMNEKNAIIIDIGGSSLEITLMKDGRIKEAISLPLGCIPLSVEFNNVLNEKDKKNLENYIFNQLDKIGWIKGSYNIIGIGGTIRTISKINRKKTSYPLNLTHNYRIDIQELDEIYESIQSMDEIDRRKVKGLAKERIDIFTAPLGAIVSIMKYCNSSNLIISEVGIREGLIYSSILKESQINILEYSLMSIGNNYCLDKGDDELICNLSGKLCEVLGNDCDMMLLKAAIKLRNIGKNINVKSFHNHAFYIITNTNINGLTHEEIVKVAYIVAMIGKREFKLPQSYKKLISEIDRYECKKISSIIYIGYVLVRYLKQDVRNIDIDTYKDVIKIKVNPSKYKYIVEKIDFDRKEIIREGFKKVINFI